MSQNRVLPLPEPPTTSTFLFRAFLGSGGRLDIISRSVLVRMMLSENFGAMNGSMSLGVPHRAEPYSMPWRYFFAFLLRKYTASRSPVPQEKPISKSSGCRLGRGFANATGKVPIIDMMCSPNSLPSASRHASPRFVATSPSRIYGRYSASSFVSFFVVTVHAPVPCAGLYRGVLPPPAPVHAIVPAPRGVYPCSAAKPNTP